MEIISTNYAGFAFQTGVVAPCFSLSAWQFLFLLRALAQLGKALRSGQPQVNFPAFA
jgi:hypothetical protein